MDSSDGSSLDLLLEVDWELHEVYTRETIFHFCAKKGWLKMLCAIGGLIDENVKPRLQKRNMQGHTCLQLAVIANTGQRAIRIIEKLVQYGADLNVRERYTDDTLLHMAVKKEDYELVAWMCQQTNIGLEIRNISRLTAFQVAFKNGDKEMMKVLETHGAINLGVSDSEEEEEDKEEEESDSE
uniref:Viral ankyrin 1 n=1 Tax=Microplitis mediator bracovirus TaxID=1836595 RepID=A0A2I6SGT7_9VIRU|nr:viral ankyrin 1 [Microplitis mediator bracovirus]AUO16793.1 viral ankyrin 1 [Microplitis mediator bracovirus]